MCAGVSVGARGAGGDQQCVRVSTSRTDEYTYFPKTLFIHYWTINYIVGGAPKNVKRWAREKLKEIKQIFNWSLPLFLWLLVEVLYVNLRHFKADIVKNVKKTGKTDHTESDWSVIWGFEHIMENYIEWRWWRTLARWKIYGNYERLASHTFPRSHVLFSWKLWANEVRSTDINNYIILWKIICAWIKSNGTQFPAHWEHTSDGVPSSIPLLRGDNFPNEILRRTFNFWYVWCAVSFARKRAD